MAQNEVVFICNKLSRALGHGHSLSDEVAEEIPSIRSLQLAWQAEGARENDSRDPRFTILAGMEGWQVLLPEREKYEDQSTLVHCTGSGRLEIEVSPGASGWCRGGGERITLTFVAGGETPLPCAEVVFDNGRWEAWKVVPDLLSDRPDRIDLLWRIDREIGGTITADLKKLAENPKGYFSQENSRVLLDAKQASEEDAAHAAWEAYQARNVFHMP